MVLAKKSNLYFLIFTVFTVWLIFCFFPCTAFADGILSGVEDKYVNGLAKAYELLKPHIVDLFWFLMGISIVLQFGFMALDGLDWNKLFGTWVRLLVFSGIMMWIITEGPKEVKEHIIDSFLQVSAVISTAPDGTIDAAQSASDVVSYGINIFSKIVGNGKANSAIEGIVAGIIAFLVLIIFTIVAVNLLMELLVTWFAVYMGIVVLGFGGLYFTKEWAIAYLRTCIAQGLKLMTIFLIVTISYTIINEYVSTIAPEILTPYELTDEDWKGSTGAAWRDNVDNPFHAFSVLANILVYSLIMLLIIQRVPNVIASLVSGNVNSGQSAVASLIAAAAVVSKVDTIAGKALGMKSGFTASAAGKALNAVRGKNSKSGGSSGSVKGSSNNSNNNASQTGSGGNTSGGNTASSSASGKTSASGSSSKTSSKGK